MRRLRRRVITAAAVSALLAVVGAIGVRLALDEADRRNALVMHTLEVIGNAQALARRTGDASSAMRGYLLLSDSRLLGNFVEATETFAEDAHALELLVADNLPQVARVAIVRGLFREWREAINTVVQGHDGVIDTAERRQIVDGTRLMAELRTQVDQIVVVERDLLERRRSASATFGWWIGAGAIGLFALAVLLASLRAYSLALRVARDAEQLADAVAAVANGDLERRITVTGADELARASAGFNEMAERLDRRKSDEDALARMRDMLHASHSSTEAHDILARLAPQCLDDAPGTLYVMNASRNLLMPAIAWGGIELAGDDGFGPNDCWALRSGRAHVVGGDRDVPCTHARGPGVCLPLIAQGESVGLLHLARPAPPRLAREVGEMVGLTLANLRLREVLRNQAIRDPLTGLFNRRYLEETLVRELSRAKRQQAPLSLVVLDVDHFKRFNDTHGHAGGDAMLKAVGATLATAFRASDVVCRYGGEEFVVVAPDCLIEIATTRVEEMRARVRALSVTIDAHTVGGVTLSAGIAMYPQHGDTTDALFAAADRAVYQSKANGRDRITLAA